MMMSQLLEITGAKRLPYLPEPQEEVKGKGPGKANADGTNYRPGVASTSIGMPYRGTTTPSCPARSDVKVVPTRRPPGSGQGPLGLAAFPESVLNSRI